MMRDEKSAGISIRVAVAEDASLLAALGKETFHDAFSVYPQMPLTMLAAYLEDEFTPAKLATQLADQDAFFLLAELDGVAVGYAKMEANKPLPGASANFSASVSAAKPIKLKRLYCRQAFLGRGVGARLMERCVSEAIERQHDGIYLTVWEHNQHAQAFYRQWAYEACGTIDFLMGETTLHDIVMQKLL
jgi:GNAT superfamily N-acetyltransferase